MVKTTPVDATYDIGNSPFKITLLKKVILYIELRIMQKWLDRFHELCTCCSIIEHTKNELKF